MINEKKVFFHLVFGQSGLPSMRGSKLSLPKSTSGSNIGIGSSTSIANKTTEKVAQSISTDTSERSRKPSGIPGMKGSLQYS